MGYSKRDIAGIKHGYRSGLEEKIANQLVNNGISPVYEATTFEFIQPEKRRKYTPDFYIPGGNYYVESKGRFTQADRMKHKYFKASRTDIEIRFVFSNANAKLYKGSKTTYAQWCEQHGFKWAHKTIPQSWLEE